MLGEISKKLIIRFSENSFQSTCSFPVFTQHALGTNLRDLSEACDCLPHDLLVAKKLDALRRISKYLTLEKAKLL